MHDVKELIEIFNRLFSNTENTVLVAGKDEPIYLPAHEGLDQNRIFFAHGFFSSALHEIAHWCIAGSERRKLVDYGYWYNPDGRTAAQQEAFAQVEAQPQALEWILSKACNLNFVVSLDNLAALEQGEMEDFSLFKKTILEEIESYKQQGLNARAQKLYNALSEHYNTQRHWRDNVFTLEQLR